MIMSMYGQVFSGISGFSSVLMLLTFA